MFKRTKGYLLLTMLVLTGLAGRLHSHTLSGKERRNLVTELKNSKQDLVKIVSGLSKKQFDFRPGKNKSSIRECVYQAAFTEQALWKMTRCALQYQATQFHGQQDDVSLVLMPGEGPGPEQWTGRPNMKFRSTETALSLFRNQRTELLTYAKTTTENLRAHAVQTSCGFYDAYQMMLLNAVCTQYYIQRIEAIKSNPRFPK